MSLVSWKLAVLVIVTIAVAFTSGLAAERTPSATAGDVQMGGPVFVSGDDAEDHCEGTECGGLYAAALKSLVDLSRSPGSGIVAISMSDDDNLPALQSWNNVANGGPGTSITVVSGPSINSVDFAQYDVIFVPSNEHDDGEERGIPDTDLTRLNSRQADIVHFVNNLGGGLMALTEQDANPSLAFSFLPIPLEFMNVDYVDAEPTAALADLAPAADSDNMDHDNWHNVWTGPPGFGGLEVLAVTPEVLIQGAPAAAILGGAQVVLRGQLDLTPDDATNPIGTEHTLTVTIIDPLTEEPVPGIEVSFEITDGPNAGLTADVTTDESGQATFAYVGNDVGNDIIEACFTDQNQDEHCDVATKEWILPLAEIQLSPESGRRPIFGQHTVTATLTSPAATISGEPLAGIEVDFEVTAGPNVGQAGQDNSNAQGEATFTYAGGDELGDDTIVGCFTDEQQNEFCDEVTVTWALQKGDDQCDKDVDAADALQNLRSVAGFDVQQSDPCPIIGNAFASIFGDMDCDDDVDAVDALHILRFIAALPSLFGDGCDPVGSALAEQTIFP